MNGPLITPNKPPRKRSDIQADALQRKNEIDKQSAALSAMQIEDARRRYAYLLGQTDIFAHFLNISKMKSTDARKFRDFTDKGTKKSDKETVSRGRRKTEKEEDEELLKDDLNEERPPSVSFTESPSLGFVDVTGGQMRDYQIQGLNWLISLYENGINGILADEMGLGKTLQSISFLGYLKHFMSNTGPHLVIVPKSTLHNWYSEFKRWVPSINAFIFHGPKEARAKLIESSLLKGNFEVCITSYEMCLLEKSAFNKVSWQYIVIDEAHRIKNENSSLSNCAIDEVRNRLLLTGTPLQNNLHELWALLNFLLPDVFSSAEDFDNWFTTEQDGDQDKVRMWYKRLLEKDIDAVNGATGRKESKTRLQNIVMQLRKCCNHPYLFDGAEPGPPYTTDQHLVDNSGKMALLDKLLQHLKTQGSRVLLFSQMTRVLDILEDYCMWKGFEYCRLDGSTAHEDRISSIDEFNRPDSSKFIFLLTTRAGGLGINLATADIVIMYDNDWNPQVDLQAEDRAHRIGQKKQVVIFRFITENAIEEKVIDRATQKLRLDQLVINKAELFSLLRMTSTRIWLDDLQKFTVEDSSSAYQWEGEDFRGKRVGIEGIGLVLQSVSAKVRNLPNYDVDSYYRQVSVVSSRPANPRPPKPKSMNIQEYQFYPSRLHELNEKEKYSFWRSVNYKPSRGDANETDDSAAEKWLAEEEARIESAEALTERRPLRKNCLVSKDLNPGPNVIFRLFVKPTRSMDEGKELEEVEAYSSVLAAICRDTRLREICWYIEKGEARLKKIQEVQESLSAKIGKYRIPLQQLKLSYGQNKGKNYTEEEDRFWYLFTLGKFGYGTDDIYERFVWKSVAHFSVLIEIMRRCNTLVMLLSKEIEADDDREDRKRKSKEQSTAP
ncbi:hypothetical protein BSLG_001981, partial [Batrachochytrium salamandrivorans]